MLRSLFLAAAGSRRLERLVESAPVSRGIVRRFVRVFFPLLAFRLLLFLRLFFLGRLGVCVFFRLRLLGVR